MSLKERTINVDIMTKEYTKLKYKQGDSNQTLKFKFYKNGSELDLTGYVAGIFYEKPNNEVLEKTGNISSNTVTTTITSGVLNTAGIVKTEIFLTKDTEVSISFTILIEVETSIDKNAAVQEKEEWDVIKDLLINSNNVSMIDDTTTATNKTWSSSKINSKIKDIADELDNIVVTGGGLSYTAKKAILDLFSAVAYYNEDVTNTYQVLRDALLVAVDSITLDKTELTFTSATSQTLVATKSPVESEGTLVWTSSNTSVATVDDNGVVTATGNGECTITVTCGSVYATCSVSVSGILATYSITNNLTNVTTSNNIDNIAEGTGYIATLTANSNYIISSVTVTMGGEDITLSAYSNGSISISSVTGDVVITAMAVEDVGWVSGVAYNIEWLDGIILNSNTAEEEANTGFSTTPFLPVKGADMLVVENHYSNYGIFYYDENKSFLGRSETNFVVSNTNYHIPRNVHYVRILKRIANSVTATPYDNEQLLENTQWEANAYYSLNWKDGATLNTSTGVEITSAEHCCSNFSFCYGASTLQFSTGVRTFVFFYDSNKEFIEYKIRQNLTTPMEIPSGAQYFRFLGNINVTNYWVQLV